MQQAEAEGKAHCLNPGGICVLLAASQTGLNEVLQALLPGPQRLPLPADLGAATELWKVQPDTLGGEKSYQWIRALLDITYFHVVLPLCKIHSIETVWLQPTAWACCLTLTNLLQNSHRPSGKAATAVPSCQAGKTAALITSVSSQKQNCPPGSTVLGQTSETCTNALFDSWRFGTKQQEDIKTAGLYTTVAVPPFITFA